MSRFPVAEWQAQQARFTAFPMLGDTTRSLHWWEAVADRQPDETTSNPKKGSALVKGTFDPGSLILKMEIDRIDWLLAPSDDAVKELATVPEFATLGPEAEAIRTISAVAEKWLSRADLPPMGRIAFGAVLIHPETDLPTGYRRLPEYVPVRVDPESSDFLYQINLPPIQSATGIDGLKLNRLSRWAVVQQRVFTVNIEGAPILPPVSEALALRLELDINTVPSFSGPIPSYRLVELFRELVAAAQQIAADGVGAL